MKLVLSRVSRAAIAADGVPCGQIGAGLIIYIGVMAGDTDKDAEILCAKATTLRVFPDSNGRNNLSLLDIGGQALAVSNFTLCADTSRGHRPDYTASASREEAERLYMRFVEQLKKHLGDENVACGVFGAHMDIEAVMDGPITIVLG